MIKSNKYMESEYHSLAFMVSPHLKRYSYLLINSRMA